MDIRLDWNETFSIGEPLLDAQHQELFKIINALPEDGDRAKVRACVLRLFRYTREHFSAEEDYMRSIRYVGIEEHIRIHEDLIEKLSAIAQEPLGATAADLSFKRFVLQWISEHILVCDKAIQKFVERQPASN